MVHFGHRNELNAIFWTYGIDKNNPPSCTIFSPNRGGSCGTWYWHVKAMDSAGNPGSCSTYWSITITIPDLQLWIDPSSHTVRPGGSTTYTVYVKCVYGFSGVVSLGASISPSELTIPLALDLTVTLSVYETKP